MQNKKRRVRGEIRLSSSESFYFQPAVHPLSIPHKIIDLIRQHVHLRMVLQYPDNPFHLVAGIDPAGGVVGVAKQKKAGARRNQAFKF